MTNSERGAIINIRGEKGHSLFYTDYGLLFSKRDIEETVKRVESFIAKYDFTPDDRALAIIGALTIENDLDDFLSKWIRGYKHIVTLRDFTFSFKVDLAISLKIIPPKIFNAIEPIRKIRNIFAHNLDVDSFEKAREVDSKSSNPTFPMLYDKIKTFVCWKQKSNKETFKYLIICVMLALNHYKKHLVKLQNYIWKPKNRDKIMAS